MAAPSYTTDLSTFNLAENSGTWNEFTNMLAGGLPDITDTDDPIQGSYMTSQTAKISAAALASISNDYGTGVTIPTDGGIFIWHKFDAGGILETYANGGVRIVVGSAIGDWKAWKVGGKDVTPNPYGGWKNYVIDPTLSYDYTYGSPSTTYRFAGMAICLTATGPTRGQPHKVDAIRFGRGEFRVNGGESANYATFPGMAAKNDANNGTDGYNKWGLLQAVQGGYLWKGLMTLGYSSVVDFRDSNTNIFIDDTRKVGANFNKIEIRQSGSRVDWTGISFICTNPSTTASKGRLEVIDDADVNLDSCSFVDMDTLIFKGNSTILTSIFRRCGLVTQNGAVFNGCTFDKPSGAVGLLSDDLNDIDNCDFISDDTGHAIELTSAHLGTSKTLVNVNFTGYAGSNGSSGDEAIKNNSGGAVTITIDGGSVPSVYNVGASTTTIVTSARTIKVVAQKADGTKIQSARVLLRVSQDASGGFPYDDIVTISNSGTTATVTHTGHGMATNDKVQISGASLWQNNGVFPITWLSADSYSYTLPEAPGSSPTGTIKASFVFLEGLTDANGELSVSRVIGANQTVIGWARKSSAAPYYKEGSLAGQVVTTGNLTLTAVLSPDE
jgi:hypothetical protein